MKIIDNYENGLYLAPSKIQEAGVGLFTSKGIPEGIPICEYKGDVFDEPERVNDDKRYDYTLAYGFGGALALYTLQHPNLKGVVDCQPWHTKSLIGLGGFANDVLGYKGRMTKKHKETSQEVQGSKEWFVENGFNCEFWPMPNEIKFIGNSLRNILPGEEIYASYGDEYWQLWIKAIEKNPNHFTDMQKQNQKDNSKKEK